MTLKVAVITDSIPYLFLKNKPPREKTTNVDSDQVQHKPGCTATGDG